MTSPANATPESRSQSSTDTELKEPGRFHVIFLNDDYTPMDFVQKLLQEIFYHDADTSSELTKLIHEKGKGVAGTYVHEVAEQKGVEVLLQAREQGYPLEVKLESS